MDMVAEYGGVQILERLQANRTEGCTEDTIDYAAKENHLEVVQWLHENRPEGCTTPAMDNAETFREGRVQSLDSV